MKPSFHHRMINGPYEDPVIYIRLFREKRAIMFDCGDISAMSLSEMLRVTDLFVTHTHIDHFIGFDRILRSILSRRIPLRVYGPSNIIDAVEGKLRGYTWNLIKGYPLEIEVHAIEGKQIRKARFRARNALKREDLGASYFDGTVLGETFFKVRCVELDHGIPCIAYSLEEEFHINIIKTAIEKMGIPVGPWLRELKHAIWRNQPGQTTLDTGQGMHTLDQLRPIVRITKGQKLSYITDATPTERNIALAAELATGSTTLYCETFFTSGDAHRARDRNHLTSADAAEIALRSGSERLTPLHFSDKYKGIDQDPGVEALAIFSGQSET